MDHSTSTFNVNDLLIEELALMNRFAELNQISFEQNLQEDIPSVHNNPSLLQFIIFALVHELLDSLESGSTIRFSSYVVWLGVEIAIESEAVVSNGDELVGSDQMFQILDFSAEKMNIGFNRKVSGAEYLKFILTLPTG